MPVFFAGRLWESPAAMSAVDDSALANRNLSVGNVLAIIGTSTGGQPNTALAFGGPSEARAALRSGPLADAIEKAFDPSSETGAPATVIGIRVNPATKSALQLKDASNNDVIELESTDYGLYTTQVKVKVESGSNVGKKLTTQLGNDYYTDDDVARNALSVQYSGAAVSATMTITDTQLQIDAPTGSPLVTVPFATYGTVQQVVDRLNSVTGLSASVLDGNGETSALNALDHTSAVDIKTAAYTVTANLQAIVDWFNSQAEGFITATRVSGAAALPVNIGFTYLSGGADGSVTNSEWQNAFTALQTVDAQWVVPLSNSSAIHAMCDAHVNFMSTVGRRERRAICGTALSTSDDAAIALAKALNSDRTSLVHLGAYDYNTAGVLELKQPSYLATVIAAGFAGMNPGNAMTNKSLKVRGLERKLRNPTDTDKLIRGGVLAVEDTASGFRVVKSISTWLNNTNYNRREVSVGTAIDFTVRNVRQALEAMIGQKGSPIALSLAVSITESQLSELARPEPAGPGVLVGDAESPAYKNIRATLDGDVLRVEFQASPVIPINYIPITVYAVPYSGRASI